MIKYEPGTVHPDEYDWREQFALEGVIEPFIKMDVGKVRGMAIALDEARKEIHKWKKEVIKWQDTNTEVEVERNKYKKAIQDYLEGNYPHPRSYRPKDCPHGQGYWEECEQCNDEHFVKALEE